MTTVHILFTLSALCFVGAFVVLFVAWNKKRKTRALIMARLDRALAESRKPVVPTGTDFDLREGRDVIAGRVPTELPPVTDWFPYDVKPVHEGRYECRRPGHDWRFFADYRGGLWYANSDDSPLALQIVEWRACRPRLVWAIEGASKHEPF